MEAPGSVITAVLAAIVSIATLLFGWLKVRAETAYTKERFETVHDRLELEQQKIDLLEEQVGRAKLELAECLRHREELEVRVKQLESGATK